MLIVHVFAHVKPDKAEAFKVATSENAHNSIIEPGIARFDVIQQQDDPARFILVEIYRTAEDPGRHKETAHYKKWRDTVADMMAEPRTSVKYINVYPDDTGWGWSHSY
jgi:autoinducer 2-degrading protein